MNEGMENFKEIESLRERITELEEINKDHQDLNAELRMELKEAFIAGLKSSQQFNGDHGIDADFQKFLRKKRRINHDKT